MIAVVYFNDADELGSAYVLNYNFTAKVRPL
jgi:hypothetical protein